MEKGKIWNVYTYVNDMMISMGIDLEILLCAYSRFFMWEDFQGVGTFILGKVEFKRFYF